MPPDQAASLICAKTEKIVTQARPGRRYVQIAQEFGSRAYVYSICNENWTEAMEEIARIIAEGLSGPIAGN